MKLSFRGDTAASADFFPFLCLPMDMHCKADPFSAMHREYWSPAPSAALPPVPPSLPTGPCPAQVPLPAPGEHRPPRPALPGPGAPSSPAPLPAALGGCGVIPRSFCFCPFPSPCPEQGLPATFRGCEIRFFFFFLFSSGFGGVWLRFRLSVADRQIDVSSTLITARSWRLRAPARGVRLKAEPRENGAR